MHKVGGVVGAVLLVACGAQPLPEDAQRTQAFKTLAVEKGVSAKVVAAQGYGFKFDERNSVEPVVEGDRLVLRNARANEQVEVTVYAEELSSFELSGKSEIVADGLSSERVEIRMSGQSLLRLSGIADVLEAHLTGQAQLRAAALEANTAELQVSGQGDCQVTALTTLRGRFDGNARCEISGAPEAREVSTSGNADVVFH